MLDPLSILPQVALSFVGTVDQDATVKFQRILGTLYDHAWCADFVWYCVKSTLAQCQDYETILPANEFALALWDLSPSRQRHSEPRSGYVVVWERLGTGSGHCGIVVKPGPDAFQTVEGNTGCPSAPKNVGVWKKVRLMKPLRKPLRGDFLLRGFINPFQLKAQP